MHVTMLWVFCRSFAGEGLERERFGEHAMKSYHAGVGFAHAKANLESLNRHALYPIPAVDSSVEPGRFCS